MIYWLNEDSRTFLERGYLEDGVTPEERIREIAETAERILGIEGFADKFEDYMHKGWYSLSSPVWSNFGLKRGLPISCNGSTLGDRMESILAKTAEVGMMTKYGAGTSAYFGELRGRGAPISVGGTSSGAVHFMELFEAVTNNVSQSNVRRGSFAAYLPVEHPDIEEFLTVRDEGHPIQQMSIGVTITDKWMEEMIEGDVQKRKIWASIIRKRFESGYPYIMFTDNANKAAPQVYKDKGLKIRASNLCVRGDQRVPSQFGMLTAKELAEKGKPLVLTDGKKNVMASPMTLIEEDVPVYKITLANGMTHVVTGYHKVAVRLEDGTVVDKEALDLTPTDSVVVQSRRGIFGNKSLVHIIDFLPSFVFPDEIWEANEESQAAYIRSLDWQNFTLDGDPEFLANVQLLCANLGLSTHLSEGILTAFYTGEDEAWTVESVVEEGTADVYCCTVDTEESRFICNGILTHNCSEIMLASDEENSFVCNLSSMNLLHWDEWKDTDAVKVLTYFLDAVMEEYIEKVENLPFMGAAYNFARSQRALGIGVLGWHSYLQKNMIPFEEAGELNIEIFRHIEAQTRIASREMAALYGEPPLLEGYGLRNVTTMAVAPTTSSSFILGQVSPSIEPLNSNYFVKDLAKGKFTYKNPYLSDLLEKKGKNTKEVWRSILMNGGSVQHLDFLTEREKAVFKTFGEISPIEIVTQAAERQPYIDQGQSLNLMIHPQTPPKEVSDLLIMGWKAGIKSFYYQRGTNPSQEFSRELLVCSSCEA